MMASECVQEVIFWQVSSSKGSDGAGRTIDHTTLPLELRPFAGHVIYPQTVCPFFKSLHVSLTFASGWIEPFERNGFYRLRAYHPA